MAVNINFGAQQTPNFLQLAAQGYQYGREQAKDRGVQNAFSMAGTDPEAAQNALLRYGDIQDANSLRDRTQAGQDRAAGHRLSTALVSGDQPGAMSAAADLGPDTVLKLQEHVRSLHASDLAEATAANQRAATYIAGLQGDPATQLQQAQAYFSQHPELKTDPNSLTVNDFTPQGKESHIKTAMTYDQMLKQAEQAATLAETTRNHRAMEGRPIFAPPGSTPFVPNGAAPAGGATDPNASPPPPAPPAGAQGFDAIYSGFVAPQEGGYTASDGNGAPANFGINQKANPDINVRNLTADQARQVLHDRYWGPSGADALPAPLAAVQFDTAVNMGVGAAKRLLQQSGGDPQTYLQLREARYRNIAARDPSKRASLPTWLSRNQALGQFIAGQGGGDQGAPPAPEGWHALAPVAGKPDPNGSDEPPDPPTVRLQAGIYLAKGVLPQLGAGKYAGQWKTAILKDATRQAQELGLTANDIVAGTVSIKAAGAALQQAEKTLTAIQGSEQTVVRNADYALSLAPKGAGTTGIPIINAWQQHLRDRVWGSPEVSQFNNAIGTVADEYAKVMTSATGSGGASSEGARNEAYSRLSKSGTPEQLTANIEAMKVEMANRIKSLSAVRDGLTAHIRAGYGEGGVGPPAAPAAVAPTAQPPAAPHAWPNNAALDALAAGKITKEQFESRYGPASQYRRVR